MKKVAPIVIFYLIGCVVCYYSAAPYVDNAKAYSVSSWFGVVVSMVINSHYTKEKDAKY